MTAPSGQISAGMLILVDPEVAAEPGKLVIAQWPDSRGDLSQATRRGRPALPGTAQSDLSESLFTDECRIIGVVVQATVKF
jgi:SOS-response transcriptional repressor LexA